MSFYISGVRRLENTTRFPPDPNFYTLVAHKHFLICEHDGRRPAREDSKKTIKAGLQERSF